MEEVAPEPGLDDRWGLLGARWKRHSWKWDDREEGREGVPPPTPLWPSKITGCIGVLGTQ